MTRQGAWSDSDPLIDRIAFTGLLVILCWLPWPWGSNTEIAAGLLGCLSAGFLSVWLAGGLLRPMPMPRLSPTAWASLALMFLWIAWIAAQLFPLPEPLLRQLSPAAAEIHGAVAAVNHAVPLNTLSISPADTASQLILTVAYACLYVLVLVTVRSTERARVVLLTVTFVGLAQAAFATLTTLSGTDFGFLGMDTAARGRLRGTFVNPNHFAAYLQLTMAAALAVVLAELGTGPHRNWKDAARAAIDTLFSSKMRARVFLGIMVIALIMTRSRMGNVAFFAALALCGGSFVLLRYRRWFGRALILFLSLMLIDVLIVSRYFGLEELAERIEQTELESERRFLVYEELAPVIQTYELTGAGLGTFGLAYSPFQEHARLKRFDHAHNEYAQFIIETGLVGAGILGLIALIHVIHSIRVIGGRRSRMRAAVGFAGLMSAVAVGIHSALEFNLRIPAIAATLIALQGLTAATRSRTTRPGRIVTPDTDGPPAGGEKRLQ